MTQVVQLARGPKNSQDNYVGPEAELTVDTSNWDLRLHDGTTPGGRLIINRNNGDERWQAKSLELDGFTAFEPQERGFLVRLGPADYILRQIEVDTDQLTLVNGVGYAGNPLIGIAPIIATDHTFDGLITFNQAITATGGVDGDTRGTHTGAVVGDVTGNVVGNLTGNAAGDHTGTFTGSVDTTAGTLTLGDKQVPLAALADDVIQYIIDRVVPVGGIIAWSGSIESIPAKWLLCDGANGTPDLRDRFILGAGLTYVPGLTGGAATHDHALTVNSGGAHAHTVTIDGHALSLAEMPAHKHGCGVVDNSSDKIFNRGTLPANTANAVESNSDNGSYEGYTETVGSGDPHTHTGTLDAGGSHSHTGTIDSKSNLPPYYVLAYIMKESN